MPEAFDGFVDFVGYPVAQQQPEPEAAESTGIVGFIDFTGIPVAQSVAVEAPVVPPGCLGFIDFTGIPCGQPPVARTVGNVVAAGRKFPRALMHAMLQAERSRSLIEESDRIMMRRVQTRIALQKLEYDIAVAEQKQAFETSINALLAAEI